MFATNIEEVNKTKGEIRAGGTDIQERLRSRVTTGEIIDIARIEGLDNIETADDSSTKIGALAIIADVGRNEHIQENYPALALPAQILANPQTRETGTMGGVLCQRTRCWYYRHPNFSCYKKGGDSCPAREGNHHFGVCIDLGPCVFPHPSSIGLALLAYDAEIEFNGKEKISTEEFFGDGTDPSHDNTLKNGEMVTGIFMPTPVKDEKVSYFRLMSRKWAEWALIEIIVRLKIDGETIKDAKVAVNGAANIPLRLNNVEEFLIGKDTSEETFKTASEKATEKTNPLPQTKYKVEMLKNGLLHSLEAARDNMTRGKLVV